MILICDHKLLIFNLLLIMSVVACEMKILTFTAYEGGKVEIRCPYESEYETHKKYLCRGKCPIHNKDIPVESGSAKDERFSLTDNTTALSFTITITDLRSEDKGQYWCAVKRTGYDVFTEIILEIKHVTSERKSPEPTTTASDHSTEPAAITSLSPQLQRGFTAIIIMPLVMGILMVFGLSSFIYFRLSQRKEVVQSRDVVHVSAENLLTEEATHTVCHYEEIFRTNNHAGFSLGLPVFGEHDASDTLSCSTVLFQTTDHSDRTSARQELYATVSP
ncbi:CMRF35-like molecule 7 [Megalobrama amblycephala]|uniref:CMRF35-like molecule 7 n=1 Tax=Megalobrama amblycephala TaxID=75352 RepID=UPI0020146055|nr:CMRF35-like molecule 7 [Megalobrama amblycephala]